MGAVSQWPETLSSNKKRVMEELVNGQEYANQLQILFQKSSEEAGRLSAKQLVQKILTSFNETLSVLTSIESAEVSHENQATSNDDSPFCDNRRSEDSCESRKRPPASKDRRGCYKRKRAEQARTVVSATVEDGLAWRKYGQKQILNSKHPRSYFRCTRKYAQGCRAIKQVQRMGEGDPQMYQITYIGTHTCRSDSFKPPQMIKDSKSWESYNRVTSGNSKILSKQPHGHHLNPSNTQTVKQEPKEETITTSDLTNLDSMIMWKDLIGGDFEYSSEPAMGSDYGDVVSNVYSSCPEITSQNLELDLVIKPVEFENDFQFDEIEFV